jgi:hypothetical protein
MVPEALSKRIHGVARLMLIYGNTPEDIKKMILRRKYKLITIAVILIGAFVLIGCTAKPKDELKALDKFWDTLGGKTENLIEKVK